jgi:hypothetical protein
MRSASDRQCAVPAVGKQEDAGLLGLVEIHATQVGVTRRGGCLCPRKHSHSAWCLVAAHRWRLPDGDESGRAHRRCRATQRPKLLVPSLLIHGSRWRTMGLAATVGAMAGTAITVFAVLMILPISRTKWLVWRSKNLGCNSMPLRLRRPFNSAGRSFSTATAPLRSTPAPRGCCAAGRV